MVLEREATVDAFYLSANTGGADRWVGNVKLSGMIRALGHSPPSSVFPGQQFDLEATLTGITGSGNGEVISLINGVTQEPPGYVMCTKMEIHVPRYHPQQENLVYYVVHFGPGGSDIAISTTTPPTDTGTPAIFNVKGLGILLDGVAEDGVMESHLVITNSGVQEIDSSANGYWYTPRANIDWTLKYVRTYQNYAALPTPNAMGTVQQQVTSSLGWTLSYGRVLPVRINPDRKKTSVLEAEVTIEKCENGTSMGSISTPAGVQMWP